MGDELTKPNNSDRFEMEKYDDDKDRILKKLAQLKTELEEVNKKEKKNKEDFLVENQEFKKITVESFNANYQILQKLISHTQLSSEDINDLELHAMRKLLHNWSSIFEI